MAIPPLLFDEQISSERGGFLLEAIMSEPVAMSSAKLLELFKNRGMIVNEQDVEKINHINYYKLKEFAHPLCKTTKIDGQVNISYEGVTFQEVLRRYYQDKNLRMFLLHAIEKIEVSIKTVVSHEMGLKYGAYGYLNFGIWANRKKYTRFQIEEKQHKLKKDILYYVDKSDSKDLDIAVNRDTDGFPTIWLAVDVMTFGDMVSILEIMNDSLLRKISATYKTTAEEFLSWVRCLQFARNICAHNLNLIDLKLTTKPKYRKEWMTSLYFITSRDGVNKTPTNRLAVVLCIAMYLVMNINVKYKWDNINKSIRSLCCQCDERANLLGFASLEGAKKINDVVKLSIENYKQK